LLAPVYARHPDLVVTHELVTGTRAPEPADLGVPALAPYEGLADVWHAYTRVRQADYAAFLDGLRSLRGLQLKSVLDLACGTGTLAARLAAVAGEVVGVDASDAMLARARAHCAWLPGVEFRPGDFRALALGREFDAAVCGFNSLNYLNEVRELDDVLAGVARHLRPGGVFAFDTITHVGMGNLSGAQLFLTTGGVAWEMYFAFDPAARVEVATVVLPSGVERHRRIPIDPADVLAAARRAGLRVDEYFSHALVPGRWLLGGACFFVLSKPG
jgi:SAM-dependent methyltransferase